MPVLPNKLAEFVQAKYGVTPEELHKLFASMERVNDTLKVTRRRKVEGKEYSKPVGGRKDRLLAIADAVEYEQKRAESRQAKEKKVHEDILNEVDFDELMVRLEVNDSFYPKRLTPTDIVNSISTAADRLEALDSQRAVKPKIYSAREETVLDVITLIKKQEPLRVARHIAERQRAYIFRHSLEELEAEYAAWRRRLKGEPEPETEEERLAREAAEQLLADAAIEEEERIAAEEAARNFDELAGVHTLLDDVAALIRENPEAAAAIVRQWIGNPTAEHKN